MKLLRYGSKDAEKPGILDMNDNIRDLSSHVGDIDPTSISPAQIEKLASIDIDSLPLITEPVRLGPPVAGVGKLVGIGLNYRKHAEESGLEIPSEPILFMKSTTSIVGPNDDVMLPYRSTKADWEVELGVVIGSEAIYVAESDSLNYVAGFCVANDVSERAFQIESTGQWVKGKSADTFCPLGPYLVTIDEVPDPQNLDLWLEVDGNRYQNGSTSDMIFGVAHLVSYVSHYMRLMPGDLILTGTPSGVGMGLRPQVFLKPGNVMRLSVDSLGVQTQHVVAFAAE